MSEYEQELSVDDSDLPIDGGGALPEGTRILLTIEPAEWNAMVAEHNALTADLAAARQALAAQEAQAARLAALMQPIADYADWMDERDDYADNIHMSDDLDDFEMETGTSLRLGDARAIRDALKATPAESRERWQLLSVRPFAPGDAALDGQEGRDGDL